MSVKRNDIDRWVDKDMYEFLSGIEALHEEELNKIIGKVDFDMMLILLVTLKNKLAVWKKYL